MRRDEVKKNPQKHADLYPVMRCRAPKSEVEKLREVSARTKMPMSRLLRQGAKLVAKQYASTVALFRLGKGKAEPVPETPGTPALTTHGQSDQMGEARRNANDQSHKR